jgi:hypothetical protein
LRFVTALGFDSGAAERRRSYWWLGRNKGGRNSDRLSPLAYDEVCHCSPARMGEKLCDMTNADRRSCRTVGLRCVWNVSSVDRKSEADGEGDD